MKYLAKFACLLFVTCFVSSLGLAKDPTPAEVLAKHYASFGPAEKVASVKTMFVGGAGSFEARTPVVRGGGKAAVVSDPTNLYFIMSLNSREYPFEKIGMFGDKVSLPFVMSGQRSMLGSFLQEHSTILSESLFGGATSLRWITNVAAGSKLKMAFGGTKKINDRKAYAIDVFTGSGSSEFKVRMYFDVENGRHMRSEYKRDLPVRKITFGRQNEIGDARLELTEEFSDFKDSDGLMLPYDYKVTYTSNNGDQNYTASWGVKVINYVFNQKLAPDFFTFDTK